MNKLSANKPTLLLPEVLSKIKQSLVSCLIVIIGRPILTSGIGTRLQNVIMGIVESKKFSNIKIMYIGYRPKFELPSCIEIIKLIPNGLLESQVEAQKIVHELLETSMKSISYGSTVGFLSVFQSGTDLRIVKNCLKIRKDLKGIFIGCESSFAYTNEPREEPLKTRVKKDKRERKSFVSSDQVTTYFLRISIPYIPVTKVVTHPPLATYSLSTSIPISQNSLNEIVLLRNKTRSQLRDDAANILLTKNCPLLAESIKLPQVIRIHLVANEHCYDKSKVGKWWTPEQYQDALNSAQTIIKALCSVSQKTKKYVLLTARQSFINYISGLSLPNVYKINNISDISIKGVYISGVPELSEDEYIRYMASNDLTIHRTIQANAYTRAICAGIACLIFTIPGKGYMDAKEMDHEAAKLHHLIHFTSSSSVEEISNIVSGLILNGTKEKG